MESSNWGLPVGVKLETDGSLSGAASGVDAKAEYVFVVEVTDGFATATRKFSVTVYPPTMLTLDKELGKWTSPLTGEIEVLVVGAGGCCGTSSAGGSVVHKRVMPVIAGKHYSYAVGRTSEQIDANLGKTGGNSRFDATIARGGGGVQVWRGGPRTSGGNMGGVRDKDCCAGCIGNLGHDWLISESDAVDGKECKYKENKYE